jgi:hypothetical protein
MTVTRVEVANGYKLPARLSQLPASCRVPNRLRDTALKALLESAATG